MKLERGTFSVAPIKQLYGLSANEQICLVWIWHHSNNEGRCWPSHKVLSKETSLSVSTVQRAIKKLLKEGRVTLTCQYDAFGQKSNVYEVPLTTPSHSEQPPPLVSVTDRTKTKGELKEEEKKSVPLNNRDTLSSSDDDGVTKLEALEWWNGLSEKHGLSKLRVMNDQRWRKAKLRFKEGLWKQRSEFEAGVEASSFLRGCSASETLWRVSFDWVVANQSNWIKVIEGQYHTDKWANWRPTNER